MATLTSTVKKFVYFHDLQAHLDGIPAHRIRLVPTPGEGTEQDVLRIKAREGRVCELIDGVLVEKAMGYFESRFAIVLAYFLETYLEDHDLGIVLGADGFLRVFPGQIRAPDVSFISWKRMPGEEMPPDNIAPFGPDLAVEVLSESNTLREMERKTREYFRSGSKLVWIADPELRTVEVFTSSRKSVVLTEDGILQAPKLLPGFTLPVRKWLARASRKPRK